MFSSNKYVLSTLLELGAHVGGSITNTPPYMFSNIYASRSQQSIIDIGVTFYNLKKACYFLEQCGKQNINLMFFHSSLFTYPTVVKSALTSLVNKHKHSVLDTKWSYGLLTNFITHFDDIFSYVMPERTQRTHFSFKWLFMKVLFHVLETKIPSLEWTLHFSSTQKFWRLVSFFKCYRQFNRLPGVFVYINPSNDYFPTRECNYLGIPVVGTLDADFSYTGITFPIVTNDDSLLLAFYYYTCFVRSYSRGEIHSFFV